MAAEEKICFVIAPIGEPDSEIRERSDAIFQYIITPAAESCGYIPIRADKLSESGMITTQVIQHLINDSMVIADPTGRNPNVYYELAVRHALRKPFLQLIQQGEQIPFDIAGMRTIPIDHKNIAIAGEATAEIKRQMESMQGEGVTIDSPISVAVDMDILRRSTNPEDRQLADVFSALTDLKTGLSSIEKKMSEQSNLIPTRQLRELLRLSRSNIRVVPYDRAMHHFISRELAHTTEQLGATLKQIENAGGTSASRVQILDLIDRAQRLYQLLMNDLIKLDSPAGEPKTAIGKLLDKLSEPEEDRKEE
jgi:hypothetical protein